MSWVPVRNSSPAAPSLRRITSTDAAFDDLELRFRALAPEADLEFRVTDPQVAHGHIRQPVGQVRIDEQTVARRIREEAEHRLEQHEGRTGGPGLRHVGAKILDRKVAHIPLDPGVQLGQLVGQEVACRVVDVVRDRGRFGVEPVAFETDRDDAVVVRPDGAGLIIVGIE